MPRLMLQCKKCGKIFYSGFTIETQGIVTLKNNKSRCAFCHSMESIPDGTFKTTVEGFINILEQTDNPLKKANDLFESLQKVKTSEELSNLKKLNKFSKFKKWIPDSPEKIAAYIAIIYTIIQLLTQSPGVQIEYNTFINQYNQIINVQSK